MEVNVNALANDSRTITLDVAVLSDNSDPGQRESETLNFVDRRLIYFIPVYLSLHPTSSIKHSFEGVLQICRTRSPVLLLSIPTAVSQSDARRSVRK